MKFILGRENVNTQKKSKAKNNSIVAADFWIGSDMVFVDDFWVGTDSIFVDDFWVNKGYVRWRIHVLAVEAVSLMISKSTATQFSLMISESIRVVWADESMR
jgi:hypothetical protein